MMKVRRGDSRKSWSDLNLRIAELRERLDWVEAHTACSYCGAGRPTTAVRAFDARRSAAVWHLRHRCCQYRLHVFYRDAPRRLVLPWWLWDSNLQHAVGKCG